MVLSVTGEPYDTLSEAIFGKNGKDNGSLKDFGISFIIQELTGGKIDLGKTEINITRLKPKIVYIQRSRGYSTYDARSVSEIEKVVRLAKQIDKDIIVFVDNCYGEFVEKQEPTQVGADIVVGSLCKNIGGGIVPTGGYVVGRADLIKLVENRLIAPSLGFEVGSYEMGYRLFYEGLFLAPSTVKNALFGAYLIGEVMASKGYRVFPSKNENCYDIIKSIEFNDEQKLIKFVQLIQKFSPVDSDAVPVPWQMPGYNDKVIMAAGTFVQGASIELSCDSPIRPPYMAYFQGGLTYEHAKLVALEILKSNEF